MNCFYHHDVDAVGACKSCGKGICAECAVDMGKGLACRDRCEADVSKLIALIKQNVKLTSVNQNIVSNMRRNTYVQAVFFLGTGAIFFLTGLALGKVMELPGLLGMVFMGYGIYIFWRGYTLPPSQSGPDE